MTNDEFINLSILKHGDKYLYHRSNYINSKTLVNVTCPKHNDFTVIPYNHYKKGSGCPLCLKECKAIDKENFISKVTNIYGDRYDLSNVNYISPDKYIVVYDKLKNKYKKVKALSIMYNRSENNPNPKEYKKYTLEIVKDMSNAVHEKYYNYDKFIFKTLSSVSIITCPLHGDFETSMENHIFKKYGCRKCGYARNGISQSKGKENFIKDSIRVHGDLYTYDKVIYVSNKVPLIVTCKLHGDFPVRPDNHTKENGTGCPMCKQSKGEKKIYDLLVKLGINFIQEYKIPNFNFRYDFYLPDYNILIEYDGALHFKAVEHFGGEAHLNLTKYRDLMKNRLAKKYGYRLIRLKYLDINNLELQLLKKISITYRYIYKNKLLEKLSDLVRELEIDNIKEYFARDYRVYKVK